MSIEETYKGMWSSDPDLLKSLLDAGETIIAKHAAGFFAFLYSENEEYWYRIEESVFEMKHRFKSWSFLIPPPPLVLEPKPLEWEFQEESENNIARFITNQWPWHFHVSKYGSHWAIYFEHDCLKSGSCEDAESAKAAIHEWRVNHLKSMLP